MTDVEFESDAFLVLLTDALRDGPGTPTWHEALQKLRAQGIEHADEMRLLVKAREHLESGLEYRSVRAGPEFSRKLIEAIDQEANLKKKPPVTTTTIALASAGVMLLVLILIGYLLWTAAENRSAEFNAILVNTVTSAGGSGPLPPDWVQIGELGVESRRGGIAIRATKGDSITGGGAYWPTPLDPSEPFSVIANFRYFHPDSKLIPQLFITDDPNFDPKNGTTTHEMVWLLRDSQVQFRLPSGRVEAQTELTTERREASAIATIRITLDRDQVIAELGGKQVWSGVSGMDQTKPRYVGVRFLKLGETPADGGVFEVIKINTRQK